MAGSEVGEKHHSPRVIGFPLCDKLSKNGLKSPPKWEPERDLLSRSDPLL